MSCPDCNKPFSWQRNELNGPYCKCESTDDYGCKMSAADIRSVLYALAAAQRALVALEAAGGDLLFDRQRDEEYRQWRRTVKTHCAAISAAQHNTKNDK